MARLIVAALLGALLWASGAVASDARAAVEAFLARFSDAKLTSLAIEQTFTLYDPTGRYAQSTGEQRVSLKLPRRQRIEQTMGGRREVRLVVDDAVWIRRRDGKVHEAPRAALPGRDASHLLVPALRSAADLLSEWRTLGIRDGITHMTRHNGREVMVIGAAAGDRESAAVWLDPEYGVVRVVTREKLPAPYGATLIDLTLSEHRPLVGGYYYPFREEWFANGKLLILIVTRSIVANPPLADALFDPAALGRER